MWSWFEFLHELMDVVGQRDEKQPEESSSLSLGF